MGGHSGQGGGSGKSVKCKRKKIASTLTISTQGKCLLLMHCKLYIKLTQVQRMTCTQNLLCSPLHSKALSQHL